MIKEKDAYIESFIKSYDGNILRIVSDKDELNGIIKRLNMYLQEMKW